MPQLIESVANCAHVNMLVNEESLARMFGANDIREILQYLIKTERLVRLLNNYKGIPISYDARFVEEIPEGFIIQVNKYQNVCMENDRFTFIQSDQLPAIIRAKVLSVDIVQEMALLSEFSVAPENIGAREAVRVQPKDPITIVLASERRKLTGSLVDISVSGMGITIVTAFPFNPDLVKKAPVTVEFKLPINQSSIKIQGTLVNIMARKSGNYRLGVMLNTDTNTKQMIARFIAARQAEILREMRAYHDVLYKIQTEHKADAT